MWARLVAQLRRKPIERKTYVMDVEWKRSEELRPDRLGPSQDDIQDPERPTKTLGPY